MQIPLDTHFGHHIIDLLSAKRRGFARRHHPELNFSHWGSGPRTRRPSTAGHRHPGLLFSLWVAAHPVRRHSRAGQRHPEFLISLWVTAHPVRRPSTASHRHPKPQAAALLIGNTGNNGFCKHVPAQKTRICAGIAVASPFPAQIMAFCARLGTRSSFPAQKRRFCASQIPVSDKNKFTRAR